VGQKVNPKGFRIGVYSDWDAHWFARGATYGKELLEDVKIRDFLSSALENAEVSKVQIDKAGENIKVIIHSARPGVVIGKKGQEIESLKKELASRLKRSVDIAVQEIKNPELDAQIVANNIADQLVKRVNFKKVMKKAVAAATRSGAKGIKICCSGRLGGAEIARSEWSRFGSIPLHTLRSNIDYALAEAKTTYGIIGVKVWICKGEYQYKQ
jgi:small subunit ribosomal protein S3